MDRPLSLAAGAGASGARRSRIVVVERGWSLDHPDLPPGIHELPGPPPSSDPAARDHGLAMLGILCGLSGSGGRAGAAPPAAAIYLTSCDDATFGGPDAPTVAVEQAIRRAVTFLTANPPCAGDILLLPLQWEQVTAGARVWRGLPIETEPGCFEAIRLATDLGITVIEAAGNGRGDLDEFRDGDGRLVLRRSSNNADFRDSRAIVVAGAITAPERDASILYRCSTNYGSRVDCLGRVSEVLTCRPGGYGPASGSSAAAAVVARTVVSGVQPRRLGITPPSLRQPVPARLDERTADERIELLADHIVSTLGYGNLMA